MFELRIQVDFAAAHHLEGYPGDCARPHGHNWVLEVMARSEGLDSIGMAIDFRKLKGAAKELISAWDHQDLNLLADFRGINPSAEQIAKLAYDRLSTMLDSGSTWIEKVIVWENDRCSAAYFEPASRS